jgi:hypothetical protein
MSNEKTTDLPFEADTAEESQLWETLGDIPGEEPSPQLRRNFYRNLEKASRPTISSKLRALLGFSGNMGWLTATACILVGIGAGQMVGGPASDDDGMRLAALEENVSVLNRNLILDRLENDTASKRLRGVMDAAALVGDDEEIATALLLRATDDRVRSVRTAAITALGPRMAAPKIGSRLMELLQSTESPLVQLALVDLVLRNGSNLQISELQKLAGDGLLHPDIASHVLTSLEGELI